jgi:hypothetical protein
MTYEPVQASKNRQRHDGKQNRTEPQIDVVVVRCLRNEIKHQRAHARDEQTNHQQLTAIEQAP